MECSAERCQNRANTLMALFVVFSSDLCMAHATKFLHLAAQCASAGSYPLSYDPSVNRAARATKIVALGWDRSMH